jgi:hypothetical protein
MSKVLGAEPSRTDFREIIVRPYLVLGFPDQPDSVFAKSGF